MKSFKIINNFRNSVFLFNVNTDNFIGFTKIKINKNGEATG